MTGLPRAPLAVFHQSDRVKATSLAGREPRLVVSFTGVGKPGARYQAEEFVRSSRQNGRNHVLFVSDTLRSWYNDPGLFEEILDVVGRYRQDHGITETVTFGNSMGGYGAIVFAGRLGAKSCLAISPQYSVDPAVVPEEERWKIYRERIVTFTRPPLADTLEPDCTYFVLHGGGKVERPHWSRFPVCPNLHHYIIGKVGHGVGKRLKSAGLINRVTECAIGVRPVALRRALGGELEFRRRSSRELV
ncbi:hypothetical protein [Roseovarius indicus]|uniref:hypothetical protein n=1 Tax=Roseovarius indicus TaxID=540747 RepID=UPI0032F07D06